MPMIMPGTITPQTMVMHMPTPRMIAPATPSSVAPIALPLKTKVGLPSIFRRTSTMASRITVPITPSTMPGIIAPHSGSSAMHIPRAKRMPPTVLMIRVTKSFFFISGNLHLF